MFQRDSEKVSVVNTSSVSNATTINSTSTICNNSSISTASGPVEKDLGTGPIKVSVKIKKLENFRGELPRYQSAGASGFDVCAQMEQPLVLKPGERAIVPTGLSFEIPLGYEIQARPRSGLAAKHGLSIVNTPGTIDADYRGEVKIILINLGNENVHLAPLDRCAQLVIAPVLQAEFILADELSSTERGAGGFGSTGVTIGKN